MIDSLLASIAVGFNCRWLQPTEWGSHFLPGFSPSWLKSMNIKHWD